MDSVTIPVPTLTTLAYILIGIGVIVVVVCLRRIARFNFEEAEASRVQAEASRAEEARREEQKLKVLFPHPWDEAYGAMVDIHKRNGDYNPESRMYLRRWLVEHTILPHLSREAVHKLACLLTFEYGERWEECIEMLAPYSDVKPLKTLEEEKKKRESPPGS